MLFLHCTVKLYEPSPTLTVEETADRQLAKVVERKKRAAESRQRLVGVARRIEPEGKLKCVWYMFVPVMSSIDFVCTQYIQCTNKIY